MNDIITTGTGTNTGTHPVETIKVTLHRSVLHEKFQNFSMKEIGEMLRSAAMEAEAKDSTTSRLITQSDRFVVTLDEKTGVFTINLGSVPVGTPLRNPACRAQKMRALEQLVLKTFDIKPSKAGTGIRVYYNCHTCAK